jgi:hypothetical protein
MSRYHTSNWRSLSDSDFKRNLSASNPHLTLNGGKMDSNSMIGQGVDLKYFNGVLRHRFINFFSIRIGSLI